MQIKNNEGKIYDVATPIIKLEKFVALQTNQNIKEGIEQSMQELKEELANGMLDKLKDIFKERNIPLTQEIVDSLTSHWSILINIKNTYEIYILSQGEVIRLSELNELINQGHVLAANNSFVDSSTGEELDYSFDMDTSIVLEGVLQGNDYNVMVDCQNDKVEVEVLC